MKELVEQVFVLRLLSSVKSQKGDNQANYIVFSFFLSSFYFFRVRENRINEIRFGWYVWR